MVQSRPHRPHQQNPHDCVYAGDAMQAEQLAVGRLGPGSLYNESVLYSPAAPLPAHLVARMSGTTVVCFELASIKQALGAPGGA